MFDECLAQADEEEAEARAVMVGPTLFLFCFILSRDATGRRRDGLIGV